jgi:hypothetical protein
MQSPNSDAARLTDLRSRLSAFFSSERNAHGFALCLRKGAAQFRLAGTDANTGNAVDRK